MLYNIFIATAIEPIIADEKDVYDIIASAIFVFFKKNIFSIKIKYIIIKYYHSKDEFKTNIFFNVEIGSYSMS